MKKLLNYILLTAVLGTFLPYSALAQTTNVGVNITGSVSIDVVTTISADITLDLTTGETTPTYMEIQNNSSVPVNAKITNISTTSEGAPNEFVGQTSQNWHNLTKEETSTYVNFNILNEGQNVYPQDILPNTEIDLGTISAFYEGCGGDAPVGILDDSTDIIEKNGYCYTAYRNFYEINAIFGRNWDEGGKNFTYQIETVYSQADEYVGHTYELPDSIQSSDLRFVGSFIENSMLELCFNSFNYNSETFMNDASLISVSVNGEYLSKADINEDDIGSTVIVDVYFALPSLEASSEGTPHYLTIKVNIDNKRYTFIKKVVAYSE